DVANLAMKLVVRAARRAADRAVDLRSSAAQRTTGASRQAGRPLDAVLDGARDDFGIRATTGLSVWSLRNSVVVSHFALLLSERSLAGCGESAPSAAFSPRPARSTFAAQGPRSACPRRARPAPRR